MTGRYPQVVPILTDGVVTLRAMGARDLAAVVEQSADPEMVRWTTVPTPYGQEQAREFLDRVRTQWLEDTSRQWVVEVGGTFAGLVSYAVHGGGRAEIAFGSHPSMRGRGYLSRAARLAVEHAFAHGIEVVRWTAFVGNFASRRVAWRLGFTVDGTLRRQRRPRRELVDVWTGTLLLGEPLRPRRPWLVPPVLEGPTVRLRPWRDEDGQHLQDPDDAARRFMPHGAAPLVAEFATWKLKRETRMAMGEGVYWCLADRAGDRPLGHVQLFRLDQALTAGSGEVGYWLLPAARGRGRMGEALDLLAGHAFATGAEGGTGLHRLAAGTSADNEASNAVLRRAAFRLIGTEHLSVAHDGDGHHSDGLLWERLSATTWTQPGPAPPVGAGTDLWANGRRVRLRPWGDGDVDAVVEACTEDRTRHWLPGLPEPYDAQTAMAYLRTCRRHNRAGTGVYLAVADPVTDDAVGSVAVMDLATGDPTSGEVGYWTCPGARGRGVMTEAVGMLVRHAFVPVARHGLGLRRLTLHAAAGNHASIRVAEANGFVRTGRQRQAEPLGDGSYDDLLDFDLLAGETVAG